VGLIGTLDAGTHTRLGRNGPYPLQFPFPVLHITFQAICVDSLHIQSAPPRPTPISHMQTKFDISTVFENSARGRQEHDPEAKKLRVWIHRGGSQRLMGVHGTPWERQSGVGMKRVNERECSLEWTWPTRDTRQHRPIDLKGRPTEAHAADAELSPRELKI
jgi:hypothetical protein